MSQPAVAQEEVVICGWLALLHHHTFFSLPFFLSLSLLAVKTETLRLLKSWNHDRMLKPPGCSWVTAQLPSDALMSHLSTHLTFWEWISLKRSQLLMYFLPLCYFLFVSTHASFLIYSAEAKGLLWIPLAFSVLHVGLNWLVSLEMGWKKAFIDTGSWCSV